MRKLIFSIFLIVLFSTFTSVFGQNVERPTGGGGGGSRATPAPIPCLSEGIQTLDADLTRCIIAEKKLATATFYALPTVVESVAPSIAISGGHSAPTNPIVQATLPKPISLPTPSIYESSANLILTKFKIARGIILARGDIIVDSMAAVAFAKAEGMPILLTEPSELPLATLNAISRLNPQKIIILGGEVAVSKAVEDKLNSLNLGEVSRVWGASRFETAVELAEQIKDPEVIVVTDGNNPSLDAILVSAEYQAPLIYVNGPLIPNSVRTYILEHRKVSNGNKLKVVTVGIDDEAWAEIKGLIDLPEFLSQVEVVSELYKIITKLIS